MTNDLVVRTEKIAAAKAALEKSPREITAKWLIRLGTLCAGQTSVADAKLKITEYIALLDYPVGCFTDQTLDAAARQFKWLPSYAELTEFLDGEAASARVHLAALLRPPAPEAKPSGPPMHETLTPEQISAKFAALRGSLGGSPAAALGSPVHVSDAVREITEAEAKRRALESPGESL